MAVGIKSPIATAGHPLVENANFNTSLSNIDDRNDLDTSNGRNLVQFNGVASRFIKQRRERESEMGKNLNDQHLASNVGSNVLSKKREKKEAALLKLRGLFSSISVSRSEDSENENDGGARRQLFTPIEDTIHEQSVQVITSSDSIELSADVNGYDRELAELNMEQKQKNRSLDSPKNASSFESTQSSSQGHDVIVYDNFMIYRVA